MASLLYNGVACSFCEIPLNDFYDNMMVFAPFAPFHLKNMLTMGTLPSRAQPFSAHTVTLK